MRNLALYVEVQAYCLASHPGPLTGFLTLFVLRKLFAAWTQRYPDVGGLREVKNLQKKGVPARQRDIQRETHTHTDIDTHTHRETHTLTQHTITRLHTSH